MAGAFNGTLYGILGSAPIGGVTPQAFMASNVEFQKMWDPNIDSGGGALNARAPLIQTNCIC